MRFVAIKTVSNKTPYCQFILRKASWFASAPTSAMVYAEWSLNLVCILREVLLGALDLPRTYWLARFWNYLTSRTK